MKTAYFLFCSMQPNLTFACEFQFDSCLPLLDVLVSQSEDGRTLTTDCRKPRYSGLYLVFHSYVPLKYKSGLVRTLFDRARKICSATTLPQEETLLYSTLKVDGYPSHFLQKHSLNTNTIATMIGLHFKDLYLRIPYAGDTLSSTIVNGSATTRSKHFLLWNPVSSLPRSTFPYGRLRILFQRFAKSHVIYKFVCGCGCSHIGRIERVLCEHQNQGASAALDPILKERTFCHRPPSIQLTVIILLDRSFRLPYFSFCFLMYFLTHFRSPLYSTSETFPLRAQMFCWWRLFTLVMSPLLWHHLLAVMWTVLSFSVLSAASVSITLAVDIWQEATKSSCLLFCALDILYDFGE